MYEIGPQNTAAPPVMEMLGKAREASLQMALLSSDRKNQALQELAILIEKHSGRLLQQNRLNCEEQKAKLKESLFQRLVLTEQKLSGLANGVRQLVALEDPIGKVLLQNELAPGLVLQRETVPIGVIGIVFESRPDVIPQILSLILKSGNAVVMKGGSEALPSNRAFMDIIQELNDRCAWLPRSWAQLLDSREEFHEMLAFPDYVDLVIPRGSSELVEKVMASTRIPVLGHTEGVCHIYVHSEADLDKGIPLIIDAKASYPAACNALETLLVDGKIAAGFFDRFAASARNAGISIRGCERTRRSLADVEPASDEDWRTEYGDKTLAVRVVDSLNEAIRHINANGSHHTDAILTEDPSAREEFLKRVDSACVFANASTRFADGFRFGLGAEVGISTSRLQPRGPVGLEGLITYKYKLRGQGHTVADSE